MEILAEAERHVTTSDQLLTIPEHDEWIYSDGKLMTHAFILAIYVVHSPIQFK